MLVRHCTDPNNNIIGFIIYRFQVFKYLNYTVWLRLVKGRRRMRCYLPKKNHNNVDVYGPHIRKYLRCENGKPMPLAVNAFCPANQ